MITTTTPIVYADHASTSFPTLFRPPTDEPSWGNPSNGHALGQTAAQALEAERTRIERLLNAEPIVIASKEGRPRVVFTSGGTESNNLVLQGYRWDYVITAATEHTAIHFTVQFLATQRGIDVVCPDIGFCVSSLGWGAHKTTLSSGCGSR